MIERHGSSSQLKPARHPNVIYLSRCAPRHRPFSQMELVVWRERCRPHTQKKPRPHWNGRGLTLSNRESPKLSRVMSRRAKLSKGWPRARPWSTWRGPSVSIQTRLDACNRKLPIRHSIRGRIRSPPCHVTPLDSGPSLPVNRAAGIFEFWPSPRESSARVFALLYIAVICNVARGHVNTRHRI
jgi:hypothetical protein